MILQAGTYPAYFERYIKLVEELDLIPSLEVSLQELRTLVDSFPAEKENYAYAPGKWTIKDMLIHISDTDRIFAYRALRFARKDPQLLPAYDEDTYAAAAGAGKRSLKDLFAELELVRQSNIALFKSFGSAELERSGKLAIGEATVISMGYIISGHVRHHINVLREKYL